MANPNDVIPCRLLGPHEDADRALQPRHRMQRPSIATTNGTTILKSSSPVPEQEEDDVTGADTRSQGTGHHHCGSYQNRASDIHIEPDEERLRLRYRIDGVMQNIEPSSMHSRAHFKTESAGQMNIADHKPQDGQMS